MSENYVEYENEIAFHPSYYIKEYLEESKMTQEDFAKRLDTTPKNLSVFLNGNQSLSLNLATKIARLLNTSVEYWLNLQKEYDTLICKFESNKELQKEKTIFKSINYNYFVKYFHLEPANRNIEKQIKNTRNFLGVSSLTALKKRDFAVNFRSSSLEINESNIVKANILVQIGTNEALKQDIPPYDKKKFTEAIDYALELTNNVPNFYELIKKAFYEAGVFFVILPNIQGSKINGATKKIGKSIMLMVNDRSKYSDIFWFSLFHEIGHIIHGDFGISFESESGEKEQKADEYANNKLISKSEYLKFINENMITPSSVLTFSRKINRNPAIVIGRLIHDKLLDPQDYRFWHYRQKYEIINEDQENL